MRRFLVFTGPDFYPRGGWADFADSFDSVDEAKGLADRVERGYFAHVIDGESGRSIYVVDEDSLLSRGHLVPCTCPQSCSVACKGECGCRACREAYGDFLSSE